MDYIRDYYRGYYGGYQEFRLWLILYCEDDPLRGVIGSLLEGYDEHEAT